jgi:DNA-binding beta-propeller fold protein YncE
MQHQHPGRKTARAFSRVCITLYLIAGSALAEAEDGAHDRPDDVPGVKSGAIAFKAPAGDLPATREVVVDGYRGAIYVANGNNDSISVLHPQTYKELKRISLSVLKKGDDRRLKGVQPVALALSPDYRHLYVAEAGINAVGMVKLNGKDGKLEGHLPVGWWPSSLRVSPDGKTLYVANARGRGAGPNNDTPPDNLGSPKHAVLGSVSVIPIPAEDQLTALCACVTITVPTSGSKSPAY